MKTINATKLNGELEAAGIQISGCNSNGVVWDLNGKEIQDQPAVQAVIAVHDPTPVPVTEITFDLPIKAPDFLVGSPKPKDKPADAYKEALTEARKTGNKSVALIVLDLMNYIEDLEARVAKLEKK